ncbi:unnamed protein product [Agarophyton chilense]|eukprot:gb/GEZJ01001080.1/.p1 GENE.gb/GEZJ01001080.1/~~gb/GEZJ01001080.1/.p1  ORF type:complete len:1769 (-),score=201.15 gb/GEZJ01001080.1/:4715-10021(-)
MSIPSSASDTTSSSSTFPQPSSSSRIQSTPSRNLYSSTTNHLLVLQEDDIPAQQLSAPQPQTEHTPPTASRPLSTAQSLLPLYRSPVIRALKPWRFTDRIRTVNGVLILCLNIGVDPPNISRLSPCARLEAWTEPNLQNPTDSMQQISTTLKRQFESLQHRARFRVAPDPTVIEMKRLCLSFRRYAKDDRMLFYYNGHGVPRPTPNGEFWFFNHNYTQYIPFNLYDLHEVVGSPAVYIFDTNSAGTVMRHFDKLMDQFDRECEARRRERSDNSPPPHLNSIFLASCSEGETLPTTAALPADLFTACLTTPIKTALRWFWRRTLVDGVTYEMLDEIPGTLDARNTPLGELKWILTAITDTIAWNVLPRTLFNKLYRRDLMVASLMRNFLLANRIMHFHRCTPASSPALPDTHNHPLWQWFELAMENILVQLPSMIADMDQSKVPQNYRAMNSSSSSSSSIVRAGVDMQSPSQNVSSASHDPHRTRPIYIDRRHAPRTSYADIPPVQPPANTSPTYRYQHNPFFQHQLGSFEIWLDQGPKNRGPPEQVPMTLHSLLSPTDRLRTLQLLSRFVQTGADAVDLTLSIGMFPYVLRLLQHPSNIVRQELVFIWGKILALDGSVCSDLVEKDRFMYFLQFVAKPQNGELEPKPVYISMAFYILSIISVRYADRLRECKIIELCLERLDHLDSFVRRWACLCLTEVILHSNRDIISQLLSWSRFTSHLGRLASEDAAPDVRAAATFALSIIMNSTFGDLPSDAERTFHRDSRNSQLLLPTENQRLNQSVEENVPDRDLPTSMYKLPPQRSNHNQWMENSPQEMAQAEDSETTERNLPPFSDFKPPEQAALLLIGRRIALNLDNEGSTLVRREISAALSKAVKLRHNCFLRAAYSADVDGVDVVRSSASSSSSTASQCENVYALMWISLSELAYDSHPVVAAIARESVDLIYDQLQDITIPRDSSAEQGAEKAGTSPNSYPGRSSTSYKSRTREVLEQTPERGSVNLFNQLERDEWCSTQRNSRPPRFSTGLASDHGTGSPPLFPKNTATVAIDRSEAIGLPRMETQRSELQGRVGRETDHTKSGRIHVRGTRGRSFDLNATPRIPKVTRFPRTNSASLMPSPSGSGSDLRFYGRNTSNINDAAQVGSPQQKSHLQVVKGIETIMRNISQQLGISPNSAASANVHNPSRNGDRSSVSAAKSPPRPPRRSHSYQILNSLESLSPRQKPADSSVGGHIRTEDGGKQRATNGSQVLSRTGSGRERPRMFSSDAGNATLSLFEWSCALINRVQCDIATLDCVHEEKAQPRRITMWEKLCRRRRAREEQSKSGSKSADGSSSDSRVVNEIDFSTVRELGVYMMGAGGGAVTTMAFLSCDKEVGDYKLLATGDSMGSVGVYDVENGLCKGSFGIPSPPETPEVGISTVLCLNNSGSESSGDEVPNSRSAIILAGAYDGRAAVFKSDVQGRKYRIMGTFQASGKSFWSTVGTTREAKYSGPDLSQMPSLGGSWDGSTLNVGIEPTSAPDVFSDAIQQSGNGLSLSFDCSSSYLAAGGCENEVVRLWDLFSERCVWKGLSVQKRSWPTALSIWNAKHPKIIVVGSSDGSISVIDTRETAAHSRETFGFHKFGEQRYPIISVGTCIQGKHSSNRDVVVAADIGGELVFWDPRWNGRSLASSAPSQTAEMARIRAHTNCVTAMEVHPSGRYVATGSTGKCVKIFGPDRTMENMMFGQPTSGSGLFPLSSPIRPVTSISFQQNSSLFAIGCRDSSVVIYGDPLKEVI